MKASFKLKKLLIAVENSDYSTKATTYGFEMARFMNAEVALVHVNDAPSVVPYGDPLMLNTTQVLPELMHVQEESGKLLLESIMSQFGKGLKVSTYNMLGNTKEEILNVAEEWKADIIILGTHGRTGIDHFISGSIAESVVRRAKCPVLIIPNAAKPS